MCLDVKELKQDINNKPHNNKHIECAMKNYRGTHVFYRIKISSK